MEKQKLLQLITALARQNVLTKEEVTAAYDQGAKGGGTRGSRSTHTRLSDLLASVGGAVVFLGIAVLIGQNWEALSPLTRVLVTLGSGIAAYAGGVTLLQHKKYGRIGQAFFLLSALLLPLGLSITFYEAGFDPWDPLASTIVSGVLALTFLSSFFLLRSPLFLLFTVLFATWLFVALTNLLTDGNPLFEPWKFYLYRLLVIGLSYALLGYELRGTHRSLAGFLQGAGVFAFLLAAFLLSGWDSSKELVWEVLLPGLALGAILLSVKVHTRSYLVFGSLFLMLGILKISAEYFPQSVGWPLALVIAGFALIAIGMVTLRLGKKYFAVLEEEA